MGYTNARDMKEYAPSLDVALDWHLRSNHFPPLPLSLIEPAKRAISLAQAEEWDELIELPEGVEHRRYGKQAPVHECVRAWHLDAFLS